MKWLLVLGTFALVSNASTQVDKIEIYLGCESSNPGSCKVISDAGNNVSMKLNPEMTVGGEDVESATEREEGGDWYLDIRLSRDVANKLGSITTANVRKRLIGIFHNKVILNANVAEPITEGSVTITAGNRKPFWSEVPWLVSAIERSQRQNKEASRRSTLFYLAIVGGSIVAVLVYLFLPRRQLNNEPTADKGNGE